MGIAKGSTKLLLKESIRRAFKGKVLTLGKQDIHFSYSTLQKMAEEFGVELCDPGQNILSHKPEFAQSGYISDECLFKSLGFSECVAIDNSDYESAQYIFDLNKIEVPEHLLEAFDLIIDGGTFEHVFHIPNAFHNIFKMLKPGGRIIHLSPSSNHIDHGFYMFSPTLFWDFYETNRFEINAFQLIRHTTRPHTDEWEISDYQPGCLNQVSFGGLDDGMYAILCIVTKTEESTGDVVPQQKVFLSMWDPSKDEEMPVNKEQLAAQNQASYRGLKGLVKRVPFLYKPLLFSLGFMHSLKQNPKFRKKGLGLKVVARY
jgi:SAM-dependent methyltransferase